MRLIIDFHPAYFARWSSALGFPRHPIFFFDGGHQFITLSFLGEKPFSYLKDYIGISGQQLSEKSINPLSLYCSGFLAPNTIVAVLAIVITVHVLVHSYIKTCHKVNNYHAKIRSHYQSDVNSQLTPNLDCGYCQPSLIWCSLVLLPIYIFKQGPQVWTEPISKPGFVIDFLTKNTRFRFGTDPFAWLN